MFPKNNLKISPVHPKKKSSCSCVSQKRLEGARSGRPVPNYENRLGPNWSFFQGRVSLIKTYLSTGELTHYEVVDPNSQFRQMVHERRR